MSAPVIDPRQLTDVDVPSADAAQFVGHESRRCERRPFFAIQRIAPYDGERMPDEAEFFCVESRDLTDGGMAFFLASRPAFRALVLKPAGAAESDCRVAEVVHCTDVVIYPSGDVESVGEGERSTRSSNDAST